VTQACGRGGGVVVRREPLVWAASAAHRAHEEDPVPLALFAPGCAYRNAAIRALDASDRTWRIAYSSTGVHGIRAAVHAGIAVAALARSTAEKGMTILGPDKDFPPLPSYEITLHQGAGVSAACVDRLAEAIVDDLALPAGAAAGALRAVPLSA
jgi:DNA-binding transcriptional LysR family regulator